jgi:hypothetical protein
MTLIRSLLTAAVVLAGIAGLSSSTRWTSEDISVNVVRLPHGAMQPELVTDRAGTIHMVYLAGEPSAADVFYVRSADGGATFSPPVRVNSAAGSAVATGTIRGAQIALGRNGRVHVTWNGSNRAAQKPTADPASKRAGMPMLYSRLDPSKRAFEAQRNLMTQTTNLDGGGSITADPRGGVYVAWHANGLRGGDEASRRVWIARSLDDGRTFEREAAISDPSTGVCGCCALRLAADRAGDLHVLYRSATNKTHRDIYSLLSRDRGRTFNGGRVHEWDIGACPMTSMSIVQDKQLLGAWETDGQVFFGPLDGSNTPSAPLMTDTTEAASRRKHPRLAINPSGTVLLTWTEGTSWARGGSLAWQAFTPDLKPTSIKGSRRGVPVWSFSAAAVGPDGGFTIFY